MHLPALPLSDPAWVFAVLFVVVVLAPAVARRLRLPALVSLVLAGMIIGPNVLGLLEREGVVDVLGSAGLLYLMFMAGLELDLDEFVENRRGAVVFGALGFLIPMALGMAMMWPLGLGVLATVLLASCWASHTLLAYPTFRRYGSARSRAVATAVGATILTDTAALVVLAVVAGMHAGELGWPLWGGLAGGFVFLAAMFLWVLPVTARRFFAGPGRDRGMRFAFLLAAMFITAGVTEMFGIEPMVGAFVAGLALNRFVPSPGPTMERVEVLGTGFLVPLFLVSVGMLVDPVAAVTTTGTAVAAVVFTVAAVVAKLLAASISGRVLEFERPERSALFSLSVAQAAATLAAVMVGVRIGLLQPETVNAVVVVILVTCVLSSWLAERVAPVLPRPRDRRALGQTLVVPVARPESAGPLVALAAAIADDDGGRVLPLTVIPPDSRAQDVAGARDALAVAEAAALAAAVEAIPLVRTSESPRNGILHTITEQCATAMVMGWHGEHRPGHVFGGNVDSVLDDVTVPTVIARVDERPTARVLLVISESNTHAAGYASLFLAIDLARRLVADGRELCVVSNTDDRAVRDLVRDELEVDVVFDARRRSVLLRHVVRNDDLVIVPVKLDAGALRGAAARIARAVGRAQLLIAVDGAGRSVRSLQEELTERMSIPRTKSRT